jgi:tripartite-type tricarboxylate transporter receptor subunit TctC
MIGILRRMSYSTVIGALLLGAGVAGASPAIAQDAVAEFYQGKQMRFIIRSSPGGSYDLYSRLIGRHIVRHIPGNPRLVPLNVPGGGGLKAVNQVGTTEAQDGTVLTMPAVGITMYQALGFFDKQLQVDLRKFHWIGNILTSNPVLATFHTSKVKTLADAKVHSIFLGTSGAGSISAQLPAVYNNLLGTKFKVIYGYDSSDSIAMERGEIDGSPSNTYASYKAIQRDWVDNNKLNWILQVGLRKEVELPDVPLLLDLAKNDEERQIFDFFSKVVVNSRAVMVAPGVPADRVAALRKAFMAMTQDPAFIAEAAKLNAELSPMDGESVQKLNDEIFATPPALLERIKVVMQHRKGDEVEYQKK